MQGFSLSIQDMASQIQTALPSPAIPTTAVSSQWLNEAISAGDDSGDLGQISIDCPYQVGAVIRFDHGGTMHQAIIRTVYNGGEEQRFSNSCTILIELEGSDAISSQVNNKEMVLKIMDWRFAQTPRERYGCGSWNWNRFFDYVNIREAEAREFKLWLTKRIPQKTLDHCLFRPLLQMGLLSQRSINADLYAYVIDKPNGWVRKYQKAGFLLFKVDNGHSELFLRFYHSTQIATECFIASNLAQKIPGKMPCVFGTVSIQTRFPIASESNDIAQRLTVHGILMEKLSGQPFALVEKDIVDEISLRSILPEITIFQMQLWRFGLQVTDLNLYNFILQRRQDDQNHLSFRMVDYGALSIVHTDSTNHSTLYLPLPDNHDYLQTDLKGTIPILTGNYSSFFDGETEGYILGAIARQLLPDAEETETIIEEYRTHCFEVDFEYPFNRFIWQTIMLHLLHSYSRESFAKHSEIVYDILRRAKEIMNEELLFHKPEPWWCRALYRLTSITGDDYQEAKSTLLKLLELMYDDDDDDITRESLVSLLTETLESASEINQTQLMFPRPPLTGGIDTTNLYHPATNGSDTHHIACELICDRQACDQQECEQQACDQQ